jgi:nitroreductase
VCRMAKNSSNSNQLTGSKGGGKIPPLLLGVRLMAGQQTLNLYVEVRLLHPQPIKSPFPYRGGSFCFKSEVDYNEILWKDKWGDVSMNVSEAVQKKRAVRQFQDRALPEEAVKAILNAGRRAQSSKNTQPWRFIAIQDKDRLKQLSELGDWAGHLAGAALGVAILTHNPEQRFSIMFDAGQAASYMQLMAWELGIGSCLASIYEPDKAREVLGFPTDLYLRIAISFGYPADESLITAPPKKGGREPLQNLVHWEKW